MFGPPWDPVPTPAQLAAAQAAADPAAVAGCPQGTAAWKLARYGYASGSTAAKAAGLMGRAAQRDWVQDMVWPEYAGLTGFAAKLAAVGTAGEDVAAAVYAAHRPEVRLERTGFCLHPTIKWLGASPDLVVYEPAAAAAAALPPPPTTTTNPHHLADPYVIEHPDGVPAFLAKAAAAAAAAAAATPAASETRLVAEIKCVAAEHQKFYSENAKHAKYGLPLQYYVQIQVEMEVLDADAVDVIVHTRSATQVTRFFRNRDFFNKELLPALEAAYSGLFLPALQARADGTLVRRAAADASASTRDALFGNQEKKQERKRKGGKVQPAAALPPD